MSSFTIDFFELSFLAEACLPPRPIARTMFWQSLTDKYWEQMTENERSRLYSWIKRNPFYDNSLEEQEDTQVFDARFNPDNQYMISYKHGKNKGTSRAFLLQDIYWLNRTRYIPTEYITKIEKLNITEDDTKR